MIEDQSPIIPVSHPEGRFMKRSFLGKITALRGLTLAVLAAASLIMACESFINEETEQALREYEGKTYVIKSTITVNNDSLVKGQRVKIKMLWGKDWVKVRGYAADIDPLAAKQVLMLYMFKADFPGGVFSRERMIEKFREIALPADK
jgi:type II secretion system-associated lipoprotein